MGDLLDDYAQAALTGLLANNCYTSEQRQQFPARAFEIAGAMLDARDAAFRKRQAIPPRAAK